ncbi:phosphoribosylformylglycinamidine synthase I [Candidatus Thorarchaeota archaeon]|nr:MAG: phosphoribosylformylglycinamidine synthase I [Candidatus Thorarchaeota archaeon]
MPIAVLRFPGTNNEQDVIRSLKAIPNSDPILVPSREGPEGLTNVDGVIIPGGFSYGDYLRAGAIASIENIMEGVRNVVESDRPVLGICNGFQILAEAGLLPGVLLPNSSSHFICKWVYLQVADRTNMYTEGLENAVLRIPIAHSDGNYFCNDDVFGGLVTDGRIPFRYCDKDGNPDQASNPNGSVGNIAGVINERGNVLGLMPHPERASREILGSIDGRAILENFVRGCMKK